MERKTAGESRIKVKIEEDAAEAEDDRSRTSDEDRPQFPRDRIKIEAVWNCGRLPEVVIWNEIVQEISSESSIEDISEIGEDYEKWSWRELYNPVKKTQPK